MDALAATGRSPTAPVFPARDIGAGGDRDALPGPIAHAPRPARSRAAGRGRSRERARRARVHALTGDDVAGLIRGARIGVHPLAGIHALIVDAFLARAIAKLAAQPRARCPRARRAPGRRSAGARARTRGPRAAQRAGGRGARGPPHRGPGRRPAPAPAAAACRGERHQDGRGNCKGEVSPHHHGERSEGTPLHQGADGRSILRVGPQAQRPASSGASARARASPATTHRVPPTRWARSCTARTPSRPSPASSVVSRAKVL